MALEIAIRRFGGPEVLEARDVPPQPPAKGQIRIRHKAIGVNFTDVHGRRGDYAPLHAMPMPLVLGMEAAGVVEALGDGVERFRVGDRVAIAARVNDAPPVGLFGGECQETGTDPLVERPVVALGVLETRQFHRRSLGASRETVVHGYVEQDRPIGDQVLSRQRAQPAQRLE